MILFTLSFLMGDLYLQSFANLPSIKMTCFLFIACFFIFICLKKYKYGQCVLLAFILGFTWSTWYARSLLTWSLQKELEGKPLIIKGYVASIPSIDKVGTHFLFSVTVFQAQKMPGAFFFRPIFFRITCREQRPMNVGDQWQFLVRLKRIHGIQSPGAFDFEAWALQKSIRAEGYVLPSKENKWLSHSWYQYMIDQYRQKLKMRIQPYLSASHTSPWLLALILGEHDHIRQEDWLILRQTGTNHLMAIAGLHIGVISALAHGVVSSIWRFVPWLMLRLPAIEAGNLAAFTVAILYSALAGFSLPTKRACIMISIFILTQLSRRIINPWYAWSLAMLIVLVFNPLSVLTESFWLSFGTIALIFYGMGGRLTPRGWWWRWGRAQWVIGLGLIPLTLFFFQQCSFISFIANSVAIPWLSFLILPFCLLSVMCLFFSPDLAHFLLSIADKNLSGLWSILTWLSKLSIASWQQAIPHYGILLMMIIGILLLLLPNGMPGRWLGLIWLLPCILLKPANPAWGEVWMTLLDVGQGLSVIIQTQNHLLVYDAGPKYDAYFDAGESVVLPYLYHIGARHIDGLVISHGDNDHLGGAYALLNAFQVNAIYTSIPGLLLSPVTHYCLAGLSWQWDDVRFSFLYPTKETLQLNNDSSCVLRIESVKKVILLTGDIEKFAEKKLLAMASPLSAHLLIAPHHGSKTSGRAEFISAVNPQYVLYATGYRNRYHFPHHQVMAAYAKLHVKQFNTAHTGTLQFKTEKGNSTFLIQLYRQMHPRYWMDTMDPFDIS